jgi:hypothetical protein
MTKGKNGQQIASENVAAVTAWIDERNKHRDWHEYAYNNRINRSVLAVELDFAKSVCTQNSTVRALLDSADALWFQFETLEKAAHEAARDRAQVQSSRVTSDNNDLQKRVAELEAENRQLRKDLGAFKKQQALVEGGAAGFRI